MLESCPRLKLYQWDYIEGVKDFTIQGRKIGDMPEIGFMADEVKKKYPAYVFEFGGLHSKDLQDLNTSY